MVFSILVKKKDFFGVGKILSILSFSKGSILFISICISRFLGFLPLFLGNIGTLSVLLIVKVDVVLIKVASIIKNLSFILIMLKFFKYIT